MMQTLILLAVATAIVAVILWRRADMRKRRDMNAALMEREQAVSRLETELQAQERARRELEEVLASLQDAVVMVDAEAHVRFLNNAAISIFQLRAEDVLGAHLLEALPSFGLEASVRAAINEGKNSSQEISLYTPRRREVLVRVAPVRRDSFVAGAVVIVQDLTELRRLERVRSDFVANASHELRTPVANIRAIAETLLASPDDSQLALRFHPQIEAEAQRLSRLISDLLDLTRLEEEDEEQPPVPRPPVDLVPIIYNVINQLKYKALEGHIEVEGTFSAGCERDVFVHGDPGSLEQVVFNLLDNALSYTPFGGCVRIQIEKNSSGDNKSILLRVSDTGIGIPTHDLPRIFERFYRVDKARSRAQGGTGLGLAIVKHIVENHNGHIEVTSEVGQGTTFTVTLPAA